MTQHPPKLFYPLVLILYFLSGLASLAYEILWVRMLSLEFGVSIFGVVVTVAVFMLGLGLGSLLGLRTLSRIKKPLLVLAALELAIAVFSIAIPEIFQVLLQLLPQQTSPSLSLWYFWQFLFTGLILLLPAFLMGFGFPVVLNVCRKLETSLELIYAVNTLGAAAGALLPLLLLPLVGWGNSLYIVASVSVVVAAIAGLLFVTTKTLPEETEKLPAISKQAYGVLLAYAGIGACALMLEIGWTRLFGMLFLRTEYVLAIILSVFLMGTAVGSYISSRFARQSWFSALPVIAAILVVLGLWLLPVINSSVNTQSMSGFETVLLTQAMIVVLLTLPVTIIFGAWLPLLNRRLGYAGLGGARLYGVNSVGAAIGTLIAGFVLTPAIGTYAVIVISALLLMIFSMAWIPVKRTLVYIVVVAVVAIPVYQMVPVSHLVPHRHPDTKDLYYYEDALSITHVIEQQDGQRLLLADLQRMDASSDPASVHSQRNQARLPLILHPSPNSILFLGLGTGISVSASLGYSDLKRTAVELSRGAIHATGQWFQKVNNNVQHHTTIIRDDARRFLKIDTGSYDIIVGDLFHPDLVGRSALLSKQQFQRVKQRLNNDGIFVQWLALNQFDRKSLDIVLRTFKRVFPDAILFLDAFRLAMVGINGELKGLSAALENISRLDQEGQAITLGGESTHTWFGRYWGKISISEQGEIQDEWNPQIEFRLPQARYSGEMDLAVLLNELLKRRPHVSVARNELGVDDENKEIFERAYIGTELAQRSWLALLQKKNSEGYRLLKSAYQANPDDRWISEAVADATLENFNLRKPEGISELTVLQSVLKISPDHPEAIKRLWLLYEEMGDQAKAMEFKNRLAKINPLDISLKN